MKILISFFILFNFYFTAICRAQTDKYHDLLDYVTIHFDPPQSVKDVCPWQAALVMVVTNSKGKVIKFDMLNKTSAELKNSYKFLLGYQFPVALHATNKTIVFCQTMQNEKSECYKERQMTAEDGMRILYACLTTQFERDPKTIFLDTTLYVPFGVTDTKH